LPPGKPPLASLASASRADRLLALKDKTTDAAAASGARKRAVREAGRLRVGNENKWRGLLCSFKAVGGLGQCSGSAGAGNDANGV
jgi:hypothetical protein